MVVGTYMKLLEQKDVPGESPLNSVQNSGRFTGFRASVAITDIELLGNGHLTTVVTGNTSMMGIVSTMLRQSDNSTGSARVKL